jgi:menaquinone-dependent protoporphyrinogen oxidase
MTQALVLYASTHGHTARIATRVALDLERAGIAVELREADGKLESSPADYDLVVVGASIHAGRHQREVADWVTRHAATLSSMPSGFFSVCLGTLEDPTVGRKYVDEFVERTGWLPRRTVELAGALQYLEYGRVTRAMIKLMMRRGGHPTDTSRNYDYTDWQAVDDFADDCAGLIRAPAAAAA